MRVVFSLWIVGACTQPDPGSGADPVAPLVCGPEPVASPVVVATETVNGSGFVWSAPASPRGLVVMFHGGSGQKEDFMTERPEAVLVSHGLLQAGYAIAALDSVAHLDPKADKTQWSEEAGPDNPDVVNVLTMVDRLSDPDDLAAVPTDSPLLLVGASNGGSMASRVVQNTDVAAVAIYVSNAAGFYEPGAVFAPMLLIPGENDPGKALVSNLDLADMAHQAGVEAVYLPNQQQAIQPGRFTRIDGVDCDQSLALWQALDGGGALDEAGHLLSDPEDRAWESLLPEGEDFDTRQVSDELVEVYAGHTITSDLNPDLLAFFDLYTL